MDTTPMVKVNQEWMAATCESLGGTNALAEKIGVDPSTVSRVQNGRSQVSSRFIAAVLTHLPVAFGDAFEIIEQDAPSHGPRGPHTVTHITHKAAS